jgi:hypothetical protein
MSPRRPAPVRGTSSARGSAFRAAALALIALGCDLRVVELLPSPDAAPPPGDAAPLPDDAAPDTMPMAGCRDFTRDDGVVCSICFDPGGMASRVFCPLPPSTVPVSPAASCRVTVEGTERCVCPSPVDNMPQTTCLKCEPPTPSGDGGQCRICIWSDNPGVRCLQCFDAAGARRDDSCDNLRREVLIYPPPTDAGATP